LFVSEDQACRRCFRAPPIDFVGAPALASWEQVGARTFSDLAGSWIGKIFPCLRGALFINQGGGKQAALIYISVGVSFSQFVCITVFNGYTSLKGLKVFKAFREKLAAIKQQDEVHNECEDIAYELLEANRRREQPRSLVIC